MYTNVYIGGSILVFLWLLDIYNKKDMEKSQIRAMLKESLDEFFSMEENKEKNNKHKSKKYAQHKHRDKRKSHDDDTKRDNDNSRNQGEGGRKDYADVRRAFEKLGGPSMVDVMKLTGIPDDEKGTNRSLFRKKVKQIKNNDTGSYYQFSDEELNRVRAALDIQN